ncbi:MAG: ferric-rhodotorulic acid/ferric-coprogen receptor FhuE [Wolinella succinogenes]|uniref:ferric-rhodotorulic acid/ferric-coprogen receptor FhuE n=1 Tax=Wolinella succinogenes TaxID=844 RepID=UPI001694CE6D|nr:ferric-rhodotorulic acid/ferric-coprogen receptor FhuE [Wolinella succinogenes]NLU33810.1 ferric-rhodotorulic acid/ferric-coprogen receptor FhuE [Wolinella succinogenes]
MQASQINLKHLALSAILALATPTWLVAAEVSVNIAPKSLAQSLKELAQEAKMQLIFASEIVEGKQSQEVLGRMEISEALRRLLEGSGLEGRIEGDTIIIQKISLLNAQTLKAVKVQADSENHSSEKSQSYTMKSMSTATGLGLSARDTPQSVSVMTRQRIEDQGLETLTDVVNNTIGISSRLYDSSRSGFSARGFDIDNIQIDGISKNWSTGWSAGETLMDTAIYDRVEIVRGATGLMSGAGNPSAAVNLVRKHADSKEFTGSVVGGVGSWDDYQGTVDVTTPLNAEGTIRARVVGSYRDKDSFMDLLSEEKSVFYGVVDMDITPLTRLSVGASYQENKPLGSTWGGLPSWYSDGTRTDWDRSKTTAAQWSSWATAHTTYFADLNHRWENDWRMKLALSRTKNEANMKLLYLSGTVDKSTGLGLGASAARYDVLREQDDVVLQVNGPVEILGRTHEIGWGLSHSKQDFKDYSYSGSGAPLVGSFFGWDGSYAEPAWGDRSLSEDYTTKQNALYGVARFSLADSLWLIAGSRLSYWEREGVSWGNGFSYKHNDTLTPYAGLIYDLNDIFSLYVSYTDIFTPQDAQDASGNYLDPITGETYEAGIKGEFFEGKLNAGFTLYRILQDNLAQLVGLNPVTGKSIHEAAKGTKSEGFELDVSGEIGEGWNLFLGYSQIFSTQDANGAEINTQHPKRMAKIFTTYRLPMMEKLTVGGGVNWESRSYALTTNPVTLASEEIAQSSFAVANLMARYEFTKEFSAQLNLNNLFDKKYYTNVGFYDQLAYGAPRNALLTIKYKF